MAMQPATARPELGRLVFNVLSDLAFMVADEEPADWPIDEPRLEGEISYQGPAGGTLRCWCTRTFALRLAANLLGLEPEDEKAQTAAEDAVRELLNVLCGQLVTAFHGTEAVFNMSIPRVQAGYQMPPGALTGPDFCQFVVEGEPIVCWYQPASGGDVAGLP